MRYTYLNNILLGLIIVVNAYVIILPFYPLLSGVKPGGAQEQRRLQQQIQQPPPSNGSNEHSLIIPAILLDTPVFEGQNTYRVLDKGILRWPGSSTPDKGGNTVLLGHRFTYKQPKGVFYHLDRLKQNDTVAVRWDGKTYVYKVAASRTVPPTMTAVLANTTTARLTLFTCTPLLWPKDRLVVTADLKEVLYD